MKVFKDVNDAERYCLQMKHFDQRIQNNLERITELRCHATHMTIATDHKKVQTSGTGDKVGDAVAKIVDLENEINADVMRLMCLKRECMSLIDNLQNSDQIDIMYKRYFRYMTWGKISESMGYSRLWTSKLHIKALTKLVTNEV